MMLKSLDLFLCLLLLPASVFASVLSDAADAMATDSWAIISTNGITSSTLLMPGGATGFITGDGSRGCYDPVAQRVHIISKGVLAGEPTHHVAYDLGLNTWLRLPDPDAQTGWTQEAGRGHGWNYGPVCDPRGRALYRGFYGTLELYRMNLDTGGWTTIAAPPGAVKAYAGGFDGTTVDPDRGRAGMVVRAGVENGTDGVIYGYDVTSGVHSRLNPSLLSGFTSGSGYSYAEYSEVHKVTMFGSVTTARIINHLGTLTTTPTPPCAIGQNRDGLIHADPATGNFVLLCQTIAEGWHIYNPVANTWTAKPSASGIPNHIHNFPEAGGTWDNWGVNGVPITDHGVILYVKCNTGGCQVSLYKGGAFTAADRAWRQQVWKAGIVRSVGFDSPNDFLADLSGSTATGALTSGGTKVPERDTATRVAGLSAMRFTMSPGEAGNGVGIYGTNIRQDLSYQIGPSGQSPANVSDTYWIQWRWRGDANYASGTPNAEPKMAWIAGAADRSGVNKSSCTQQEVVIQPSPGFDDVIMVYGACPGTYDGGNKLFQRTCGPGNALCASGFGNGQWALQHRVNCTYDASRANCLRQATNPNTWRTFTARIKVGTWYQNNGSYTHTSEFQLWLAEDGGARQEVIRFVNDHASCPTQTGSETPDEICGWDYPNTSSGAPSNPVDRVGKIWFSPYSNGLPFPSGGQYWIDSLIVATQDPGDPGSPAVPSPPTTPSEFRFSSNE